MDDAVRERHGVACRDANNFSASVTIDEIHGKLICLDSCHRNRYLTQYQARYLASKLHRLSRRIRNREEAEVAT